jgi:hypothetical protein
MPVGSDDVAGGSRYGRALVVCSLAQLSGNGKDGRAGHPFQGQAAVGGVEVAAILRPLAQGSDEGAASRVAVKRSTREYAWRYAHGWYETVYPAGGAPIV